MTQKRFAICPSCNHSGDFALLGVQRVPLEVAQKLGLPTSIVLWSCPHCHTTVSEPDLIVPLADDATDHTDPLALPYDEQADKPTPDQQSGHLRLPDTNPMRLSR
jgi:hypothetical protein